MDECPNDPNNGYGSHNVTHPLTCYVAGCDCLYALRKDAERYRWLRDYARHDGLFIGTYDVKGAGPKRFACLSMDMADAAVDAAMAATPAVGAA